MPFRFARRVRNLEIKTYCPTKKKHGDYLSGSSGGNGRSTGSSQLICPNCVLPVVVAFIFGFTVIQLIVIHRTIVAYKSRSLAYEEAYGPSHNDTKSQGDLLAFSKKFDAAWLPPPRNSTKVVEWKPEQSYPYKIPGGISRAAHYLSPINHIWKVACPEVPTKLLGNISINVREDVSLDDLIRNNSEVLPGGRWTTKDCKSKFHVALIIPYRYRWKHLKLLLGVLHPMLRRQQMSYQIFVAEQYGNYTFNKGLLMNAAFLLALNSSSSFDCVIFHDVDLLPETDRNIYGCTNNPTHLSVSIDAYGYRLPYSKLVGGVFAISVDNFIQVNGYSNLYWGWGAEDDDMYKRLIVNQLPINRPRPDLAKYKMLQHGRRAPNQFINPLIRTASLRFPQDGLTTCHFRLVSSSAQALFTHFLVDVGQPSYAVLEPHTPLPHFMPPSPSKATNGGSNNNNLPYNSPQANHSPSTTFQGGINREHLHHNHRQHRQQKRSPTGSNIDNSLNPSSFSSFQPNVAVPSPKIAHNIVEKHFNSIPNKETNKELFILSGIARDADNHYHPLSPSSSQHKGKLIKGIEALSLKGEDGKGRQAQSLTMSQHSSSSTPTTLSSLHSAVMVEEKGDPQQRSHHQIQNDNGKLRLPHEMRDTRKNPQHSSAGDVPLDPDVSVMQDDDEDEDSEEDEGTL